MSATKSEAPDRKPSTIISDNGLNLNFCGAKFCNKFPPLRRLSYQHVESAIQFSMQALHPRVPNAKVPSAFI
jgi:hypothetical protein